MEHGKNNQTDQKLFRKPIMCPWITSQPYPSSLLNKNSVNSSNETHSNNCSLNSHWTNMPISMETSKIHDRSCPSMQQSSSQFFYFLRLMQLFPETHPATLHTVLTLCKNDFFCAVDKILYAKRCKTLYNRRMDLHQKMNQNRIHPYAHCSTQKPSSSQHVRDKVNLEQMSENSENRVKPAAVIVKPVQSLSEDMPIPSGERNYENGDHFQKKVEEPSPATTSPGTASSHDHTRTLMNDGPLVQEVMGNENAEDLSIPIASKNENTGAVAPICDKME